MNQDYLLTLYYSLVYPYIIYAIEAMGWHHTFHEHKNQEKWRDKSQLRPSMTKDAVKSTVGNTLLQ